MAHIGDRLEDFAQLQPDASALGCGRSSLTWREFACQVRMVEAYLETTAAGGRRVALQLENPNSLLVCFFACARSGRVAMVLDPDWPEAQSVAVLQAINPDCRIDEQAFADSVAKSGFRSDRQQARLEKASAKTPFYAGFTSGTTGMPKGYIRDQGSWLDSFAVSDREFRQNTIDRIVLPGRLSHSLHLYGAVHGLARGIEVRVVPRFDPRAVLDELINDGGGAALYATPTHLQMIANAARGRGVVETVRLVFSSGAKWRDEDRHSLGEVFPKARLIEFYGASETSFISWSGPEEHAPYGSVGRPVSGVDVAIGDPVHPFEAERSGAIWVKSRLLFSGYICGEACETRWQGDWLTFGDRGYLDDDGFLYLTGRETRMIITSGLNVYPEEVETALLQHPSVGTVVVIGRPDMRRGERLEAVVYLSKPLHDPEATLQKHCRATVGIGKTPRKIHFRNKIPLTAGGKPDIQSVMMDILLPEQEPS